jgi:cytochrome c oxidase subunit 1
VTDVSFEAGTLAPAGERRGLVAWLTATDHKKIGLLYIGTSLAYFLVAVVFAMLMRTQLITPRSGFLSPETYNEIFTMHGTTMVFLFGMPILVGFGNYLVPLMIGARDMAFPRLNALSYWLFLFAGLFLYSSFFFGGAMDTGWFSYAPLNQEAYSNSGVVFWTITIVLLGVSSMVGAVNFIVTMLKLRAPGMTFLRMPLFALATFLNSFLILAAIPSLTVAVALLYLDREYGTAFFDPARGGDPIVWQHLFWFFGHPEVYILIVPVFGMLSEYVPVFSRKPLFGRTTMVIMLGVIGFLGFTVWAHHMFAAGLPTYFNSIMAGTSMLIAIPTGVKIFNWLATMWGGSLRFKTPLLFACGLIAFFTIGGITGVTLAIVPYDWQVTDTYYVVAHLHNVLFAGTLFGALGGFYYWFPKMTGRFLDDRLGKVHFWLILAGFALTFLPMYLLGWLGMPRRVYTYADDVGWNGLNMLATIGGYLIAVAILVFVVNIVRSLVKGERAGGDPWDAWTLEWATTSPPPATNFTELPEIASDRPLWDVKHPERPQRTIPWDVEVEQRPAPAPEVRAAHHAPALPSPQSAVPILAAVAMTGMGVGLLTSPLLAVAGGVVLVVLMAWWTWTRWPDPEEPAMPGERFSALGAGMLCFLLSEAILFGGLIYTYIHLRLHVMTWPPEGMPELEIAFPALNTDILIASGVAAHFAHAAYRRGLTVRFRGLLVLTIVLGAIFLAGQGWEYTQVGFGLSDGVMGSVFFTLTGFHGAHVTGGLVLLGYMLLRSYRDERFGLDRPAGSRGGMDAATYYWHFVDVVWVLLFIVLYLW